MIARHVDLNCIVTVSKTEENGSGSVNVSNLQQLLHKGLPDLVRLCLAAHLAQSQQHPIGCRHLPRTDQVSHVV